VVRVLVPLTVADEELDRAFDILDASLAAAAAAVPAGPAEGA